MSFSILGNIHSKHQSCLQTINLIHSFNCHTISRDQWVLAFLGATLALHEIGECKMSVSCTLRIQHACMTISENFKLSAYFISRPFEM
jgi:hypothetical protein